MTGGGLPALQVCGWEGRGRKVLCVWQREAGLSTWPVCGWHSLEQRGKLGWLCCMHGGGCRGGHGPNVWRGRAGQGGAAHALWGPGDCDWHCVWSLATWKLDSPVLHYLYYAHSRNSHDKLHFITHFSVSTNLIQNLWVPLKKPPILTTLVCKINISLLIQIQKSLKKINLVWGER